MSLAMTRIGMLLLGWSITMEAIRKTAGRYVLSAQDQHRGAAGAQQPEAASKPPLRRLHPALARRHRHARIRLDDPLQLQEVHRGRQVRDRRRAVWRGWRRRQGRCGCGRWLLRRASGTGRYMFETRGLRALA